MPPCATQLEIQFSKSINQGELNTGEMEATLREMREETLTPIHEVIARERTVVVNTGRFNYSLEELNAIVDAVGSWTSGPIFGPRIDEVVVRSVESDKVEN